MFVPCISILRGNLILKIESFCFVIRKLEHFELFERSKKLKKKTIARNNLKRQMNAINPSERARSYLSMSAELTLLKHSK